MKNRVFFLALIMFSNFFGASAIDSNTIQPPLPLKKGSFYTVSGNIQERYLTGGVALEKAKKQNISFYQSRKLPIVEAFFFFTLLSFLTLIWRYDRKFINWIYELKQKQVHPKTQVKQTISDLKEKRFDSPEEWTTRYGELNRFVRCYLDVEYEIGAVNKTSGEILSTLEKKKNISAYKKNLLESYFSSSEIIEYAPYIPTNEEHLTTIRTIEDFISDGS